MVLSQAADPPLLCSCSELRKNARARHAFPRPLCAAVHPIRDAASYTEQNCFVVIQEGHQLDESEVYILQCFFRAFGYPVSVEFLSGDSIKHKP